MKVLLIEDEVKVVQSLKKGLEEHNIETDFAYDGMTGKKMAESGDYDVIVSDIIMPEMDGYELVKALRDQHLETPIIFLSALSTVDEKVAGFDLGVDDYIVKPFAFEELLARIRALARRKLDGFGQSKNILTFADVEMNLDSLSFKRAGIPIELTPKEFALMEYFIRHQGRVISKKEIAENVWDIHFETGTNVVEVYVNYLRNKIDKPFDQKLIHTMFGSGYILKL